MEFFGFLFFLAVFVSTCQATLLLVANQSTLHPSADLQLDLNCSLTPDTKDIDRVMVLQLEEVINGTERSALASVVAGDRARFNTDFQGKGNTVRGTVDAHKPADSFLELTVQKPDDTTTGNYVCVMTYMDRSSFLLQSLEAAAAVPDNNLRQVTTTPGQDTHTHGSIPAHLLAQELQTLRAQVAQLAQQLRDVDTPATAAPTATSVVSVSGTHNSKPVAFSAQPKSRALYENGALTFENVTLNMGEAYDSGTGCFVAPVNGSYVIMAALSFDHAKAIVELQVNGARKAQLAARGNDQTSVSLVVGLELGDAVCLVGVFSSQNSTTIFADKDSVFSGFLLQEF